MYEQLVEEGPDARISTAYPTTDTNTTPARMVVVMENPTTLTHPLSRRAITVLGSLQVALSVLCIFITGISIHYRSIMATFTSYGIWSAVLNIVAGILGILVGSNPTRCRVIGHLVMCILGAVACGIAMAFAIIDRFLSCHTGEDYCLSIIVVDTLAIVMAVLLLLLGVIAILSSSFDCRAVCCRKTMSVARYDPQYMDHKVRVT